MIILISSLVTILLICFIALLQYCRIRKRLIFAFGLCIAMLVVVALVITGDITVAYAG